MPSDNSYESTDEFRYFIQLTKIPRPSGHLDRIRAFLYDFADSHGLEHITDKGGNVLIRRHGKGRTVVLQGHMDIVATSVSGSDFDFVNTPLDTYVKNGWVQARGTTLGGDDGGGLALMLCALTDPSLDGIDLECLFTADEEVGLIGAMDLDPGLLTGKILLNLDSEDTEEITIGSAGSADVEAVFGYPSLPDGGKAFEVSVEGLRGGHSAGEIDKGRSNAILVVARFLNELRGVRIGEMTGGSASNVIPMSASAVFTVPGGCDVEGIFDRYSSESADLLNEPGRVFSLKKTECASTWSEENTGKFLQALLSCPNGPLDRDVYGVKTSSNIGVVRDSKVVIKPRSSDYSDLLSLISDIGRIFSDAGAKVPQTVAFPAWKEEENSFLVRTAVRVYQEYFGKEPKVVVTHGGLESSTIKDKYPGMEAVSIGPTVLGAHTPDERLKISSLTDMKGYLFRLIHELSQ